MGADVHTLPRLGIADLTATARTASRRLGAVPLTEGEEATDGGGGQYLERSPPGHLAVCQLSGEVVELSIFHSLLLALACRRSVRTGRRTWSTATEHSAKHSIPRLTRPWPFTMCGTPGLRSHLLEPTWTKP